MKKSRVNPASKSALDILTFALGESQINPDKPTAMGTVTGTSGGVQIQFDGESQASTKTYKRISPYTPTVGDRVLLVRAGRTWVVLGKIV